MNKHTPGPWHVAEERDDDGDVLYTVEADNLPVADIYRKAEHEANARLIAAAPDMLEALEKIISSWERERLHSNQGNNHAQDEAELEKNYQIALAKLMIYEKIKAAK